MRFADFDIDFFLTSCWQQRPLLIRNPWRDWANPLEPDALAGLACEAGIESRLVLRDGAGLLVEHGPFPEARFGKLGGGAWTLLVQAVDHQVAEVAALIQPFRFVPDWRIDDVMASFATNGGGVGSHYDQYDVFLVQGLGRRRWRLGPLCTSATPLLPHDDLRLIADFVATDEWILEPGDILYVPPGFAHDGVAVSDDCMTYSIGFRAPSRAELVEGWGAQRADSMVAEDRYTDPDLAAQSQPGEIAASAIDRLHTMVMEALSDRDGFARWFGTYNSLPKYDADWRPEAPIDPQSLRALVAKGAPLSRNPASRFAFVREADGARLLFVDGHCFDCHGEAARLSEQLCAGPVVIVDRALADSPPTLLLLAALIDRGSLAFDAGD